MDKHKTKKRVSRSQKKAALEQTDQPRMTAKEVRAAEREAKYLNDMKIKAEEKAKIAPKKPSKLKVTSIAEYRRLPGMSDKEYKAYTFFRLDRQNIYPSYYTERTIAPLEEEAWEQRLQEMREDGLLDE